MFEDMSTAYLEKRYKEYQANLDAKELSILAKIEDIFGKDVAEEFNTDFHYIQNDFDNVCRCCGNAMVNVKDFIELQDTIRYYVLYRAEEFQMLEELIKRHEENY